jgi:hypothetical protein
MEKQMMERSMSTVHPNEAIEFMIKNSPKYAEAKANRIYLENYLKVVKATLALKCNETTIAMGERYALAHPDYKVALDGLKVAVEQEEHLKWWLISAQARVDVWRSEEASNRGVDRATR